jgi:hypothetical protein
MKKCDAALAGRIKPSPRRGVQPARSSWPLQCSHHGRTFVIVAMSAGRHLWPLQRGRFLHGRSPIRDRGKTLAASRRLSPYCSRRAQASACAAKDRRSREIAHAEACALLATSRIAGDELAPSNRLVRFQAIHVGVRASRRPQLASGGGVITCSVDEAVAALHTAESRSLKGCDAHRVLTQTGPTVCRTSRHAPRAACRRIPCDHRVSASSRARRR